MNTRLERTGQPIKRSADKSLRFALCLLSLAVFLIAFLRTSPLLAQTTFVDNAEQCARDFQGRFEVGEGRKMYLECHGQGSPTVVLEAGFRNSSGVWHLSDNREPSVWDGTGALTRVCAYDRPGTTLGAEVSTRSDPVPMPRTGREIVRDLHALLAAAHVPAPYILVGHSMGGIFARLYASTYPDSVSGLVLVDAFPENIAKLMGQPDGSIFLQLVVHVPEVFNNYRDLENVDLPELDEFMAQTARERPLRAMPLVVLARGLPIQLQPGLPSGFSQALERAWRKGQLYLASLIANSEFVVAAESEHYVQVEQPQLVTDAVRTELNAIRWGNERPGQSHEVRPIGSNP